MMWQERVNASVLARSFPEFAWKPERQGFGWRYRGTRGDESVTVEARSVLPYGSDDDELAETRWYVYPAGESVFAWQPEQLDDGCCYDLNAEPKAECVP